MFQRLTAAQNEFYCHGSDIRHKACCFSKAPATTAVLQLGRRRFVRCAPPKRLILLALRQSAAWLTKPCCQSQIDTTDEDHRMKQKMDFADRSPYLSQRRGVDTRTSPIRELTIPVPRIALDHPNTSYFAVVLRINRSIPFSCLCSLSRRSSALESYKRSRHN